MQGGTETVLGTDGAIIGTILTTELVYGDGERETVERAYTYNPTNGVATFLCDCATAGEARRAIIEHAEGQERHGQD